jgi:tRNA dimethylallyltransferase
MRSIIVVCGPTASRKSELAFSLAESLNGEIVCCDSVQLYKGFRIGTAAPSEDELKRLPHHLFGTISWRQNSDAGGYAQMADTVIEQICSREATPVIVGGTGLYLRSLLEGLAEIPEIPTFIREELIERLEEQGKDAMYERLKEVDPILAERIEGGAQNTQRVLRGLEVFEGTGTALSMFHDQHAKQGRRYNATILMPSFEPTVLNERINERVDSMFEKGLLAEVEDLLSSGVDPQSRPMQALGYRELVQYLNEEYDLEQTIRFMKKGHRKYAKRQRTWFRRVEGTIALDGNSKTLLKDALKALESDD